MADSAIAGLSAVVERKAGSGCRGTLRGGTPGRTWAAAPAQTPVLRASGRPQPQRIARVHPATSAAPDASSPTGGAPCAAPPAARHAVIACGQQVARHRINGRDRRGHRRLRSCRLRRQPQHCCPGNGQRSHNSHRWPALPSKYVIATSAGPRGAHALTHFEPGHLRE